MTASPSPIEITKIIWTSIKIHNSKQLRIAAAFRQSAQLLSNNVLYFEQAFITHMNPSDNIVIRF